jgi:hypothetical protein
MSCIKLLLKPNAGCAELAILSLGFEKWLRSLKNFLFSSEDVSRSATKEKQQNISR